MASTKRKTQDEFLSRINDNIPEDERRLLNIDELFYTNFRTDIEVTCKLHGTFKINPWVFSGGAGCKICRKLKDFGLRCSLSWDEYPIIATAVHNGKYSYEYITEENFKNEKIPITCPEHGIFMMRASAHISPTQQFGCHKCSKKSRISKGEQLIAAWLDRNNITYEQEKRFKDSVFDRIHRCPFDFYLPDYNLIIEYDGPHHAKPVKFAKTQTDESAEKKFERIRANDGMKHRYLMENNFKLLVIFCSRTGDIDDILDEEILHNRKITYRTVTFPALLPGDREVTVTLPTSWDGPLVQWCNMPGYETYEARRYE